MTVCPLCMRAIASTADSIRLRVIRTPPCCGWRRRDRRRHPQHGGVLMTRKRIESAVEAIARIQSGQTVMVGGFGLVGAPLTLIDALVDHSDATDLTIVSNNIGEPGRGLGKLLRQGRI